MGQQAFSLLFKLCSDATLSGRPTTRRQTLFCVCSMDSPASQQGALFEAAFCSSSGQHDLGLQHHHLRFFQKAPSVVDANMEPPLLDDNCPECAIWSWLFLRIVRTTINTSHNIKLKKNQIMWVIYKHLSYQFHAVAYVCKCFSACFYKQNCRNHGSNHENISFRK